MPHALTALKTMIVTQMVFLVGLIVAKSALCDHNMENSTGAPTDTLHAHLHMTVEPILRNETVDTTTITTNTHRINDEYIHRQIRLAFRTTRVVFMIFGIVGNGLSIAVFSQRIKRQTSTAGIYFMFLALADGILIISLNIMAYFDELETPVSLFVMSHCTFTVFIGPSARFSAVLILIITVERFLATYFPLKFRNWVSKKKAFAIVAMNAAVCISINWINFGALAPAQSNTPGLMAKCEGKAAFINIYFKSIMPRLHTTLYFLLPGPLILIVNILIIIKIRKYGREKVPRQEHENITMSSNLSEHGQTNPSYEVDPDCIEDVDEEEENDRVKKKDKNIIESECTGKIRKGGQGEPNSGIESIKICGSRSPAKSTNLTQKVKASSVLGEKSVGQHKDRLTVLCLTVSFTFLVCVGPPTLVRASIPWLWYNIPDDAPYYPYIVSFLSILLSLNHSVNFVYYFCMSSNFRKDLFKMFSCKCKKISWRT